MLPALLLTLAASGSTLLVPVKLAAACQQAGYRVWADPQGRPRVLRMRTDVPDRSSVQTQYYDARGRLLTLRASFSGLIGPLYDLTARLDGQGNIISVTGYRSKFYTAEFKPVLLDLTGVQAGRCSS